LRGELVFVDEAFVWKVWGMETVLLQVWEVWALGVFSWFSPLSSAPAARQDFTGGRRQDRKQSRRRFGLFEDEGNATRRLCGIENLCAVGFAVHPEPLGQANGYVLPRDIASEVFLELGAMIAGLERGTRFEPRFDGRFCGFDLLLELVQTATQREQ